MPRVRGLNKLAVLGLLGVAGCGAMTSLDTSYVPSAERISMFCPEFILSGAEVRGLHGDEDVPSVVFTYQAPGRAGSATEVLKRLERVVTPSGWSVRERQPGYLRVQRLEQFDAVKKGYRVVSEARVTVSAERVVTVGWVSTSVQHPVNRFEDAEPGASFARLVIWPRVHPRRVQRGP